MIRTMRMRFGWASFAHGGWRLLGPVLVLACLCLVLCLPGLAFGAATIEAGSGWVAEVTNDSAVLHATVDPNGTAVHYHFGYAPSASPGSVTSVGEGETGPETSSVTVSTTVGGLAPETSYDFFLVVENVIGAESSFTTQPTVSGTALPDGRGWEMVSPPDKQAAGIEIFEGGSDIQAAANGDAITYVANAPIVKNPEGNKALEITQVLSKRGTSDWESTNLTTPASAVVPLEFSDLTEYELFSTDLTQALVEP
jgi:hypothetical protein